VEPLLRERDRDASERNAAARAILVGRGEDSEPDPMPFIVGVPRSGTSLLRMLLDAHSSLAIPLETHFLPNVFDLGLEMAPDADSDAMRDRLHALLTGFSTWESLDVDAKDFRRALADLEPFDLTRGLRALYRLCSAGKARVGDKTPSYARHLPVVEALVPESHFIHLVRDGRDVFLSARDAPWSVARHWFPFGRDAETLAAQWRRDILLCRRLAVTSRRFLELRYEDLLADAPGQLERICAFIELPYEKAMMEYAESLDERDIELQLASIEGVLKSDVSQPRGHEEVNRWIERAGRFAAPVDRAQAQRWRREMEAEDVEAFEAVAGDVLARYGYELTRPAPAG
jgi:sulfotransferase family protein